jgi:hypothetical protein
MVASVFHSLEIPSWAEPFLKARRCSGRFIKGSVVTMLHPEL